MSIKKKLKIFVTSTLCVLLSLTTLTGCMAGDSLGRSGGLFQAVVASGTQVKCDGNPSLNAEGKVMEIDGVELKIPIDWSYAHSQQPDFNGTNWQGDDAYRGIGMFNCNEEGDGSEAFRDSYSINMRWEYYAYGYQDPGQWTTQAGYFATPKNMPEMGAIGGTSASCTNGGSIINGETVGASGYATALRKAKIMVVNPETGKACVCGPGFIPSEINDDLNWGGAPLFALGGISEAVSEAICDNGYQDIQPHTGDDNIALEVYFVDENSPYGPCEFDGSSIKGRNKDNCKKSSNVDNSDAANLAVTVSYNKDNPNYKDHEMVMRPTGSTSGSKPLPTTDKAITVRKLATGDEKTADCGYFVASIVIMTLDKNYPPGGTSNQEPYMESSDKWEKLGDYTYSEWFATGEAQPGDVLINSSHTIMWVGFDAIKAQYDYINDENYCIVGASWDKHGPYIQQHSWGEDKKYAVFRYTAEPDPKENADELSAL